VQMEASGLAEPQAEASESGGSAEPAATDTPVASAPRRLLLQRPPIPIKYTFMVLLVLQNAATTLMVRSTRTPRGDGGVMYLGGVAVLMAELLKFGVSLIMVARDEGGLLDMVRAVRRTLSRANEMMRMAVPALSFGAQNFLYYVALSHLSATSYQLWSQTKTLFTALFFVKLLGEVLRLRQWFALGLLTVGVGMVQLADATAAGAVSAAGVEGTYAVVASIGIAAVLASSVLSGFANVYFEKVLKTARQREDSGGAEGAGTAPLTLWMRNVQLGVFAIPQAAVLLALSAHARLVMRTHGVLAGFTPAVWTSTALTASGGLLVASVVKHADTVLKTYATATAILVTCLVTAVSTGVPPSPGFALGLLLVLASMALYNVRPSDDPGSS